LSAVEKVTPKNYKQALSSPDQEQWAGAMDEELSSIARNQVLEIMPRPAGIRALPVVWSYKLKTDNQGNVVRYKARCNAGGHRQREGIDYDETFAPVVRYSTVRMLLAVAAAKNLKVHAMDVDTAFLYGTLVASDPAVYMDIPQRWPEHLIPEQLRDRSDLIARVRKSIYGLKQSPRAWNIKLNDTLRNFGFRQSSYDSCLYVKQDRSDTLYVTVFVDDLLIAGTSERIIEDFKQQITDQFSMKDMGEVSSILGTETAVLHLSRRSIRRRFSVASDSLRARLRLFQWIRIFNFGLTNSALLGVSVQTNSLMIRRAS
jgi:hypothetical protein